VIGPSEFAVLLLELGDPVRVTGRGARTDTTVDLSLRDQLRNVSVCIPSCSDTRWIAPFLVAGSWVLP
jgi:hypothetical protein